MLSKVFPTLTGTTAVCHMFRNRPTDGYTSSAKRQAQGSENVGPSSHFQLISVFRQENAANAKGLSAEPAQQLRGAGTTPTARSSRGTAGSSGSRHCYLNDRLSLTDRRLQPHTPVCSSDLRLRVRPSWSQLAIQGLSGL